MEIKFYNKATLEDVPNQGDYLVGRRGEVYTKLANGTLSKCAMCDWIPAYHFATRIKELEKQAAELKESLKCVLFEMDFATDAPCAGYGTEDTDEITLARKHAE